MTRRYDARGGLLLPVLSRLAARTRRGRRGRREAGYVAVVTAIIFSTIGFGLAAMGVDTARWWLEAQRVQKAADMASLAGVTYLPQDLTSAQNTAIDVSGRNGYPNSGTSTVSAVTGTKPSQLKVTVCSTIQNSFGGMIGVSAATICRYAVADYTGPAPMGSPCNTYGNQPDSGSGGATPAGDPRGGSPYPNCLLKPQMWSNIAGPQADKGNGDRFMTTGCGSASYDGCSGSTNSEYNPLGYFFLIRVQPAGVGQTVDLQLYDPEFANTNANCSGLPQATNWVNNPNGYVGDAKVRYSPTSATTGGTTGAPYCNGDNFPSGSTTNLPTTSFAVRQQTDRLDPATAPVQNDTSGNACIKQYRGQTNAPNVNDLTSTSGTYDQQLASVFHNWSTMCRFTPARAGDYYLQVRTNISFGGSSVANTGGNSALISTGNSNVVNATGNTTVGGGNNSFAIRAVMPSGSEKNVSVSGYDRMPMFANADSASSTFNLIRVVPAGASKSIAFTFFDVGDASSTGTVTVLPPADAKTTGNNTALTAQSYSVQFPGGCKATGGNAGTGATYASCAAPIQGGNGGANNGHLERLVIPIPNDYTCSYTSQGGCWYQVKVTFGTGTVTDTTTWTATVTGDPVRLIE